MRPGDPQPFCPAHSIPVVRGLQREGLGLTEIGIRLNITKSAIDLALWKHLDSTDEDLSPVVRRREPMF